MRDGLANPLINAGVGGALAARRFSLPVTLGLGVATEVAYAWMLHAKPEWFERAEAYDATDFALDVGAVFVGWAVVAAATRLPALPGPSGRVRGRSG
jgi:hypothetical protein